MIGIADGVFADFRLYGVYKRPLESFSVFALNMNYGKIFQELTINSHLRRHICEHWTGVYCVHFEHLTHTDYNFFSDLFSSNSQGFFMTANLEFIFNLFLNLIFFIKFLGYLLIEC